MNLDWLRKEVLKEQNEIDWIKVSDLSKKFYNEENQKNSVFGLSKGFVNFIKVSYMHFATEFSNELHLIYPNVKIYQCKTQSALIKVIKDGVITRDSIRNDLVVVFSDKLTVETVFNRYKIPFFKFNAARSYRSYKQEDVSYKREDRFSWRKEGEKGFTWKKGTGLSMRRENILESLFDEE